MKTAPITLSWGTLQEFYKTLSEQLHQQGIHSLTTGGIACVLYELAQQTKDCDIIIPEEKAEAVVELLTRTRFGDHSCHLTLKYGAPIDSRWLRGGWISHTHFGPPEQPLARIDLFGRAPRLSTPTADENPYYLSRDGVARMKKTKREKDWAFTNLLGMQMLKNGDPTGVLHITDTEKLIEVCRTIAIPFALLDERPILQLAIDGNPELARYIKAEKEFWTRLDAVRLKTYADAWKPYGAAAQNQSKTLLGMDIKTQNLALVEIASVHLDKTAIRTVGWENLVATVKEQTARILKDIKGGLLPTPIPFKQTEPERSRSAAVMRTTPIARPLVTEEEYQRMLRESLGDELAVLCNLPYEERIKAIADFQNNFDTPHDKVWPAEGYTGPDLP